MTKFISNYGADGIYQTLHEQGVLAHPPHEVARVVIDLKCGSPAKVYYETFADSKLIDVIVGGGLKIAGADEVVE